MAEKRTRRQRFAQLREAYTATASRDPKLPLFMAGAFVGIIALFVVLGLLLSFLIPLTILGVVFGTFGVLGVLYRRATKAGLAEIEGEPGAAAAVLQSMRGDWQITPAVAFNVSQDMVHRVVGKPGVILVAEGAQTRTKALLLQEKKRVSRVAAEVPVYEVSVGDEDGQIPLRKLQNHILRLPRNLDGKATSAVKQRLRALGAGQPPIPKGPMPKGGRVPRGKMR
ncbi:MAG: hypothetical protein QOF82_1272 [Frankiales bacterium]|jgi:hypothetical protein|nr:hypothetical protein [Frankiales bacterium]